MNVEQALKILKNLCELSKTMQLTLQDHLGISEAVLIIEEEIKVSPIEEKETP
jgi:hypothetical protein